MSVSPALLHTATEAFCSRYGREPAAIAAAPGRVEVLGNHTDYNLGCVMSGAIDRHTLVLAGPSSDAHAHVRSLQTDTEAVFNPAAPQSLPQCRWADYVQGVVHELSTLGIRIPPFQALIHSDIPRGAGLSSSAALEVAVALALLALTGDTLPPWEVAKLARRAENQFVGMPCGILDQFSSVFGQEDSVLYLDVRSEEQHAAPLPASPDLRIVLVHSRSPHSLTNAPYAQRVSECRQACAWLSERLQRPMESLRDVDPDTLLPCLTDMPEILRRRAAHVVYETDRVQRAYAAMQRGDVRTMGELMYLSHASSRDLFENSLPELDLLVQLAHHHGALGARLTGGGWGGAILALTPAGSTERFQADVLRDYAAATQIKGDAFVCRFSQGAHRLM